MQKCVPFGASSLPDSHHGSFTSWQVRVQQPVIPKAIQDLYIDIQAQKTAILVANETRKVEKMKAETESDTALIAAKRDTEVALMQAEQRRKVGAVESRRLEEIASSENKRAKDRAQAEADIVDMQAKAQSKANELIHTPTFVRLHEISAWGNSTKIVYSSEKEGARFPLSAVAL